MTTLSASERLGLTQVGNSIVRTPAGMSLARTLAGISPARTLAGMKRCDGYTA